MNRTLVVGTRASLLAGRQTDWVVQALRRCHPALTLDVVTIRTTGDAFLHRPLSAVGGRGLFTKELEDALSARKIDLAVHSLKDLPTQLPDGLTLGAIPAREDPRDALVGTTIAELRTSSRHLTIGTCSLRRQAQLRRLFPEARIVDLRGNLDTRLRKVKEKVVDGAVLALAGLKRIGREDEVAAVFEIDDILPAPGQAALAIEIRREDAELRELLQPIHCLVTDRCVTAERELLAGLDAGCHAPLAAWARIVGQTLHLKGRVLSLDGRQVVEGTHSGPADSPRDVGRRLAEDLASRGAAGIIESLGKGPEPGEGV